MARMMDKFFRDKPAMAGLFFIAFTFLCAVFAPFLANGRPLLAIADGSVAFPFLHFLFAPDSPERAVEALFNYILVASPVLAAIFLMLARRRQASPDASTRLAAGDGSTPREEVFGEKEPPGEPPRLPPPHAFHPRGAVAPTVLFLCLAALALPFFLTPLRNDKRDWRAVRAGAPPGSYFLFAPVPYGPFEAVGRPFEPPSRRHFLGTDHIGRDILSRLLYGTRTALAVGVLATLLSIAIGTSIGLAVGYCGGWLDMLVMRAVEIIMCFPSFLLLLILMMAMMDRGIPQSTVAIIPILGLLGWTGLCRVVRGETLKQRALPYAQACEALAIPRRSILFRHILPNISGPIIVYGVFEIAANVLAESGLSFLGFGVQPPTASWGELLRQAFADPTRRLWLTLWPGLLIFLTVTSINLVGEGVRCVLDPKA